MSMSSSPSPFVCLRLRAARLEQRASGDLGNDHNVRDSRDLFFSCQDEKFCIIFMRNAINLYSYYIYIAV